MPKQLPTSNTVLVCGGRIFRSLSGKKCLTAIEKINDVEYIVAGGSLQKGVPTDIFARIALIAKKKNARLIDDTSCEALIQAVNEGYI